MIDGVDVSHWNDPVDWGKVAAAGVRFAIAKATEGPGYLDPTFAGHVRGARAAGLVAGGYHFARPGASSASAQAHAFLAAALVTGDVNRSTRPLLLALRLEDDGGLDPAHLARWAAEFLVVVDHDLPATPLLYLPDYFTPRIDTTTLGRWPLWLADVHGDATVPPTWTGQYEGLATVPRPWAGWTLWQYDTAHSLPGVASHAVDRDRFVGGVTQLLALAGVTAPHPATDGRPAPPPPAHAHQEDQVQLVRVANHPHVYVTDGITRRWVRTPAERDDLIHAGIVTAREHVIDQSTLDALKLVGPSPD